jgi:formylglycine-generating enzyme required for sulfatase activity
MQETRHFLVLVIVLAAFSACPAATYYVAPNGSDSNSGSQAQPWLSLTHAKDSISAGDTVRVAEGYYNESIRLNAVAGTAQNPITWVGEGLCRVRQFYQWTVPYNTVTNFVIGEGHQGGWANDPVVFVQVGCDGSKLLGCTVYSCVGQNQVGLNIEGNNFTAQYCLFTNFSKAQVIQMSGTNDQILNCRLLDNPSAEAAFYIWGSYNVVSGCTVSNLNEVEVSGSHPDLFQSFFGGSWGHIIENNLFINNSCQIGCLQSANGDYNNNPNAGNWTFRNNLFINCGSKLDVDFRDMKFVNNTFYNCNNNTSQGHVINFNWSKYGCGTNGLVVNNLFFLCGSDPTSPDQGWFGIDEGTNTQNLIRNSMTISNNFVAGAQFAAKNTDLLIGTNWINGGDPMFLQTPSSRIHQILLTGTTSTTNTTNIVGNGTRFTTELAVGDRIMLGPSWIYPWGKIVAVVNDTNLWVDMPIGNGTSPKNGGPQNIIRSQDCDPTPDLRLMAGSLATNVGANLALVPYEFAGNALNTSLDRSGVLHWVNAFSNGTLTVERSSDLARGPWLPVLNVFTTNAVGAANVGLTSSPSFYRLNAADLSTNPPGMELVPAGTFQMGDNYSSPFTPADERPLHFVDLSSFYIDQFEVTNERMRQVLQWAYDRGKVVVLQGSSAPFVANTEGTGVILVVLKGSPWVSSTKDFQLSFSNGGFGVDPGMEECPVIGVTWHGGMAYGNYLSDMQGLDRCTDFSTWTCDITKKGYRLPTEAEWEKAARGGCTEGFFPWSSYFNAYADTSMANYTPVGMPHSVLNTKPVGYYNGVNNAPTPDMANGYGLYDMAGNVREWCLDWYDPGWYAQPGATNANPTGPPTGTERVQRGGSWDWDQGLMRCSARDHQLPDWDYWYNGCRMVRRP